MLHCCVKTTTHCCDVEGRAAPAPTLPLLVSLIWYCVGIWVFVLMSSPGGLGVGYEQRPLGSRTVSGQQDGQQVLYQCAEQVREAKSCIMSCTTLKTEALICEETLLLTQRRNLSSAENVNKDGNILSFVFSESLVSCEWCQQLSFMQGDVVSWSDWSKLFLVPRGGACFLC